jgi:hypothetical protein
MSPIGLRDDTVSVIAVTDARDPRLLVRVGRNEPAPALS